MYMRKVINGAAFKFYEMNGKFAVTYPAYTGADKTVSFSRDETKAMVAAMQLWLKDTYNSDALRVPMKRLNDKARMPEQGTLGAAGFDLYATEDVTLENGVPERIPTGLAFEIPADYVGVVYSRSSSARKGIVITPLMVDSDYRGEVYVLATYFGEEPYVVKAGDRIAQIRIEKLQPTVFEWTDTLSETERGTGAFGSTGR